MGVLRHVDAGYSRAIEFAAAHDIEVRCSPSRVTRIAMEAQNPMEKKATKLPDGRIVHSEAPLNVEMPFETVDTFVTPTEHSTSNTFSDPEDRQGCVVAPRGGEVEKPFAINYEELFELESRTIR